MRAMAKVIQLHAERWATAFEEDGVKVDVSSKGRVCISAAEDGKVLSMEQVMRLGQALATAYGSEE